MSIKSDRWIRKMAEEHGMIEPYEPGQVRFNDAGERLVSYGTSSYGYDVRCAPEFKVFTNVHSVIVDPKNFDEKSFIDVIGDECINLPARIYAGEGVAQMLFFQSDADDVCETSYKDRGGKYQGQRGVTLPRT